MKTKSNIVRVTAKNHPHFVGTLADGSVRPEWASALGDLKADIAIVRITHGSSRGKRALITWGCNYDMFYAEMMPQTLFAKRDTSEYLERIITIAK